MINIPQDDVDSWLETLKPYQSSIIKSFLESEGEELAIELWLGASGPESTSQFGGSSINPTGKKIFLEQFKIEFKKFICGSDKYSEERKNLSKLGGDIKAYLVSTISAAISIPLGTTAVFIAPAVVIMLIAVSRIGINAWCSIDSPPDS